MKPNTKTFNRFINKVDDHDQRNNCWKWSSAKNKQGYGLFSLNSKTVAAHRVSWWLFNGDIPDNTCVCHSCDNPECTNPEHLWLGTYQDNNKDCHDKGRHPSDILSNKEIEIIKNSKASRKLLAMHYGISLSHVMNIRNGYRR